MLRREFIINTVAIIMMIVVVDLNCKKISDFRGKLFNGIGQGRNFYRCLQLAVFSGSLLGYYNVQLGDFNSPSDPGNRIQSFIDLNNDKKTDLVTVSDSGKTIRFWHFDNDSSLFKLFNQSRLSQNCLAKSVSFLDVSNDGIIEMLVVQLCQGNVTSMSLFQQNENHQFVQIKKDTVILQDNSQPLLADLNGDFNTDIIYTNPMGEKIIKFMNGKDNSTIKHFTDIAQPQGGKYKCKAPVNNPLAIPHSSAYLDLDGDCASDLFLVTMDEKTRKINYQIWVSLPGEGNKFCLIQTYQVDVSSYSQIAFSDISKKNLFINFIQIDQDGAIDIIQYSPSKKKLNLHYNLRKSDASNLCQLKSVAESGSSVFQFTTPGNNFFQAGDFLRSNEAIYNPNNSHPFTIRIADFDLDSYPDILVAIKQSKLHLRTYLYPNTKCPGNLRCFTANNRKFGDKFVDVEYASFFDYDQNGQVDIIYGKKQGNKGLQIGGLYNYQDNDAFFLKTFTIRKKNKYGDVMYGVNYRFVKTQSFNEDLVLGGAQLTQSSYSALQMPYALFGIGRSKDYIKDFKVATVVGNKIAVKSYSPIIPNSQLINTAQGNDTDKWILELFINPTDKIGVICVVIAVMIALMFTLIWILKCRENDQDKKQKDRYRLHMT